ncbi:MAG: hypothetical protein HYT80_06470 [Euryarchaeota archaeon]|nr:hypothetical protein [Euryarchaeota archaeon]
MDRNTRQRVSSALLTVTLVFALLAAYYVLTTGTVATKAFTQSFIFAIALAGATVGVRFWPDRRSPVAGPAELAVPLASEDVPAAGAGRPVGPQPFLVVPMGGLAERLHAQENGSAARALEFEDLVQPTGPGRRRHKPSPVVAARIRRRAARTASSQAGAEVPVPAAPAMPPPQDERAEAAARDAAPTAPPPLVVADVERPADPLGPEVAPAPAPPSVPPGAVAAPQAPPPSVLPAAAPDPSPAGGGLGPDASAMADGPHEPSRDAPAPVEASSPAPSPSPPLAVATLSPEDLFRPDPSAPRELLLELASYWHTRYTLEREQAGKPPAEKKADAAETATKGEDDQAKRVSST